MAPEEEAKMDDALGNAEPPKRRLKKITKAELRKIKQAVSRMRKKGQDVWTDDEVAAAGYTLDEPPREGAPPPSSGMGAVVVKAEQEKNWDCGLACAQMVLLTLGMEEELATHAAMRARLSSDSVWTIDLAYLLVDFGVKCEYVSATCDVDEASFAGIGFYDACIADDAARVRFLFAKAAGEGVAFSRRQLSADQLWNLMRDEDHVVLALVDARSLPVREGRERGIGADVAEFAGHYILVVGLDDSRDGFLYNDPARVETATFISAESLERARRAVGTDEDMIIIPIYQPMPVAPAAEKPSRLLVLEQARKAG